jgi:hypothetical protein
VNSPESWERCSAEFPKFVTLIAEPWFASFRTPAALLDASSPLSPEERQALTDALDGSVVAERVAASERLLGLRRQ